MLITATNLTDSYFSVASKQTTPEMSVIEAVVHSCCGNIALVPTILKIRKQNKNALVIDGGASILNFPSFHRTLPRATSRECQTTISPEISIHNTEANGQNSKRS